MSDYLTEYDDAMQSGRDFGIAVCEWFSLDPSMVESSVRLNTGLNEALSVTLTIMLYPDDMEGIAQAMKSAQRNHEEVRPDVAGNC
jgi:hypothetical protein